MIEELTEELTVPVNADQPAATSLFAPGPDGLLHFQFQLCKKLVSFGDVALTHCWMPTPSIYGQRNMRGENTNALRDHFWACCLQEPDCMTFVDAQETFLMAQLVDLARSTGGRNAMDDGRFRRKVDQAAIRNLDGLLAGADLKPLTLAEFQRQSLDLLGPIEYSDASRENYRELVEELFADLR